MFQTRTVWLMLAMFLVAWAGQYVMQVVVLGDPVVRFLASTFQTWAGVGLTWLGWSLVLSLWKPAGDQNVGQVDDTVVQALGRIEARLRRLGRNRE